MSQNKEITQGKIPRHLSKQSHLPRRRNSFKLNTRSYLIDIQFLHKKIDRTQLPQMGPKETSKADSTIPSNRLGISHKCRYFSNSKVRVSLAQQKGKISPQSEYQENQQFKIRQLKLQKQSKNQKIEVFKQIDVTQTIQTCWFSGTEVKGTDLQGFMLCKTGDHLINRFQVQKLVGKGSFGQVFKCLDHKQKQIVAVKIIKNKPRYTTQSYIQLKILNLIKDKNDCFIKLKHFFVCKGHSCFVFQLLPCNLFQVIKKNRPDRLPIDLIKKIAMQILNLLVILRNSQIIHCDLKPQNIMLKNKGSNGIRLIDFGSASLASQLTQNYIQSRYYRAPQILLGYPYSYEIDVWSLFTILAEMHIGYPLFPGDDENQQIILISQSIGVPPQQMVQKSQRGFCYFQRNQLKVFDKKGKIRRAMTKPLENLLESADPLFLDFLKKGLVWEPQKRVRPQEALEHAWLKSQ